MTEAPRDPNRFADAEQVEHDILVDKTGMLSSTEQATDQACQAVDDVAAQLEADSLEADAIFKEESDERHHNRCR